MSVVLFSEHILWAILDWLPDADRFGRVALVCRDFATIVWKPDLNTNLVLNFRARPKSVALCLLEFWGPAYLLKTVWSRLTHLEIIFKNNNEDEEFLMLDDLTCRLCLLQSLRLVGPSEGFALEVFSRKKYFSELTHLSIEEARCDSIESLFGGGSLFELFPKLTELTLKEIFLVKGLGLVSPSVVSSVDEEDLDNFEDSSETSSCCLEKLDLYLIPFTEVVEFVSRNFWHSFPNLKTLRFKCLSTSRDAHLLANALSARVCSLPALEFLEVGVLTTSLLSFLKRTTSSSLKKLSVPSQMAVPSKKLNLSEFTELEEISFRISSSMQMDELGETFSSSSLSFVAIQWNTCNAISVQSLAKLRTALSSFGTFQVHSRSLEAHRESMGQQFSSPFERFYVELCRDRIVCECTECESGEWNEEHIKELAQEEWDELDDRRVFSI